MKIVKCFSIVLLALAGLVFSEEKVVVCYVGTWATYRQGLGKYDVENIDTDLCTHLVYTFVGLAWDGSGTVVSLDSWLDLNADEGGGRDNFRKFNALKTINPNLKTLLAVGGYNEGSAKYSEMAADPSRRNTFISTALAMVQKYGFDGLDLDWEYPNQRDSVNGEADIDNLTTLLKELKHEFGKNGLLVTIAVAAVEKSAALSYDIAGVSNNVDYVHLMAYDLHGAWDPVTGHNAGLYKSESELGLPVESEYTVDASVQYWLDQGCPPEKLVLGMPLYGRTFALSNVNSNNVGAPANGPGISGPYSATAGLIAYNEFCDLLQKQTWNVRYDDLARVPFAVQNLNWVTYDDPKSLTEKVNYALKYNLAGAMVWSLESEDFNGVCGEKYALLKSINRALGKIGGTTTTTSASSTTTTTESNPTEIATSTSTEEPTSTTSTSTQEPTSTTSTSTQEPTSTTSTSTQEPTSTTSTSTQEPTSTTSTSTQEPTSTTSTSTQEPTSTTSTQEPTSTTSSSTTESLSICKSEGRVPNPNNCSSFYYCVRNSQGSLDAILFTCPSKLYWDQNIETCNYASLVSCSI